jgi:hypothetical protein
MEYLLGCHYRNLGRLDDAKRFFAAALKGAREGTPLHRVVQQEMDALASRPASSFSRSLETSPAP